jgi:uncharacterized membrane protein YgcG
VVPVLALGAGWLAARGAGTARARFARGGGTWAGVTGVLSMAATPIADDVRPMAMGFGVLLLGMAVATSVMIGQGTTAAGRHRVGLAMVQAAAGALIGAFALLCLSVAWSPLVGIAALLFFAAIPAFMLGGLLQASDPLRALTVGFACLAFVVALISAIVLGLFWFSGTPGAIHVLDWLVVSATLWVVLWVYARSRGWKLLDRPVGSGSTYSGGGRSSGWSTGSSWSGSSSSSRSSGFSGGGGRSGGGGASGSW